MAEHCAARIADRYWPEQGVENFSFGTEEERMNGKFAAVFVAMLVFGVAEAEKGGDKPLRTGGEWAVSLDAQGHVVALKQTTKLKPILSEPLERAIRSWSFDPGKLNGQSMPTETTLNLSLVLEPTGTDGYAIRIDDASTGGRIGKSPSLHINPSDVREASYLYVMRVAYDTKGKVVSVIPESGTPEVPSGIRRNMEIYMKGVTFEPERVGGRAIAADVVIPMCVSMSKDRKQPPADSCDWKPPHKRSPVGSGQLVAVDPAAKLLTDVVGRAL